MAEKLKIALLIIFGFAIGILIAEGAVRILDLNPKPMAPLPIPNYQLSDNPVLLYEYRPNYKPTNLQFDESHAGFSINGEGFRDHHYQLEKATDVFRILALGDSTTAGNGVTDLNDVYAKRLEKMLNNRGAPVKYEVLNMGIGGYHTVQEVELLRTKGLKYKPDLVLLLFCFNDFIVNADGEVYERLMGKNSSVQIEILPSYYKTLLKKSRFLFFVHYRIKAIRDGKKKPERIKWYEENVLKGDSTFKVGLRMLDELKSKHGFDTTVFLLPLFNVNYDNRYWQFREDAWNISMEFPKIDTVDTLEYFNSISNDGSEFSYDGVHMNEYGHEVLSQIIFNKIKGKVGLQ